MQLQKRHYRVIEFLEANPKKKFGVDELAKHLNLSMPVLRNELPKLVIDGYICRKAVGRTFEYYATKTPMLTPKEVVKAEPLSSSELTDLGNLRILASPDYTPKLAKLAWNYPLAILTLNEAAITGNLSVQKPCRKALTDALERTERYCGLLRRLLSTPQLWGERLSSWMTEGMPEKNLEEIRELTRQGLGAHGRLESQEQETT